MVSNRKFELFKIDKIMKCFLVNPTRKIQMFSLLLMATLTGVIFRENIMTKLLPPAQALSLKSGENDVINIQVGDGLVEPESRIFRGKIGTNFIISHAKKDAFYSILLNGTVFRSSKQLQNSKNEKFQVKAGENLYTIVDNNNHVIDEFIIQGIANN